MKWLRRLYGYIYIRIFGEQFGVCACGDWSDDHLGGYGPCRICRRSSQPWDQPPCDGYRFHRYYWRMPR